MKYITYVYGPRIAMIYLFTAFAFVQGFIGALGGLLNDVLPVVAFYVLIALVMLASIVRAEWIRRRNSSCKDA